MADRPKKHVPAHYRDNRHRMKTPLVVTRPNRMMLHSPIAKLLKPAVKRDDEDDDGWRWNMAQTAGSHGFKIGMGQTAGSQGFKIGGSSSSPQLRGHSSPGNTNLASGRRDPFEMPLRERLLETTRLPSREKVEAVQKLELLVDKVPPQKIFDSRPVSSELDWAVANEDIDTKRESAYKPSEERLPEQAIAPMWLEKWLAVQQSFPKPTVQPSPTELRATSSGSNPKPQRKREVHNARREAFASKKAQGRFSILGGELNIEQTGQRLTDLQTWSKPGVRAFWTLNEGLKRQPSPPRKGQLGDWAWQSCSDLSRTGGFG